MGEVLFNSLKCHRDLPATRISPEQHCILKHRWKKAANRESPCKMLKGSLLAMKQLQTDRLWEVGTTECSLAPTEEKASITESLVSAYSQSPAYRLTIRAQRWAHPTDFLSTPVQLHVRGITSNQPITWQHLSALGYVDLGLNLLIGDFPNRESSENWWEEEKICKRSNHLTLLSLTWT